MRCIARIFFLLIILISFSCEEEGIPVKCKDCVADEPLQVELKASLETTAYASVIVYLYEGNLEDSVLLAKAVTNSDKYVHYVKPNKKYTMTALYYIDGVYYTAVDSAFPRVRYEKERCTDPCYYVYDRELDLRLKYTN